jgi:hypothetical protein
MPPPLARKAKGEWAESAFLSRALRLGLVVSKPWGDNVPYDFAVEGRHGFRRVQVKSVWIMPRANRHGYEVNVGRPPHLRRIHTRLITGPRRHYSSRQVDLIAAYIVPKDAWYLIPIRALGRRTYIGLFPDQPRTTSRFERYREAWHLLT